MDPRLRGDDGSRILAGGTKLATLKRLLERDRAMFPDRKFPPGEDELRAHEALYARARALGMDRD
jgi:hypothetical protein